MHVPILWMRQGRPYGIVSGCSEHRIALRTLPHTTMSRCYLQIQSQLLGWYDKSHRALPWRRNPHTRTAAADDPEHKALLEVSQQQMIYRVWISEIMCQQTQVSMIWLAADQEVPPAVCNQQHFLECRWRGHQSTSGAGSSSGLMCSRLLAPHLMRCTAQHPTFPDRSVHSLMVYAAVIGHGRAVVARAT
jgi:hypothetical protein